MIDFLQQWAFIWVPGFVVIFTQTLKLFINSAQTGWDWKHFINYGGMPSGHTAFFTSLSLFVGLVEGFDTAVFAISLMVTIMVVRDAIGLRQALSAFGEAINTLTKKVKAGKVPKVKEILGHTPAEVLGGFLVGIGTTLILYWLIF